MSATQIAEFNALAQAAFIHNARAPHVPRDYPRQRYFAGGGKNYCVEVAEAANNNPCAHVAAVTSCVFRSAGRDLGELSLAIENSVTSSSLRVNLTPAEMRALAARLIDAAHDIELWPAARLADYDSLCSKVEA